MNNLAKNKSDSDIMHSDIFDGKISVKGKQWQLVHADDNRVGSLVSSYDIPEIIAKLLVLRDLDKIDVEAFLNPKLSKNFPDPFRLKNMDEAADYLASAIIKGRKIGILADFDVDGATSCAVLSRFLKAVGGEEIPTFIPDRLNDGYGPSVKGFQSLKEQGVEIVVILDCGITAINPIQAAKEMGLEVVVVDHHEPDSDLPPANYIINPKLSNDQSGYDYLAAVGVTYLLTIALNAKLRHLGHYQVKIEPVMKDYLDLVALGTVCDMVPLVEANRLFVKYGFPLMDERRNVGLRALLSVSNITTLPDPYHAGFMLGPRINAGSRVHQSNLGAQLLSTEDEQEAVRIAWLLDDCNEKRKDIQKDMTRQAMEKARVIMIENPNTYGLVIDGEGWHTGLSGLVSGAVKDKFEKPTCVIAYVENEYGEIEGRASGRSVEGVHLAEIFIEAQKLGILVKGGGHAMAGGFTILPNKINEFNIFFNLKVKEILGCVTDAVANSNILIEMNLSVKSMSLQTVELLTKGLAPFGMGNQEPKTVLSNVLVTHAEQIGVNHIKCTVKDSEGSVPLKAMAFRALESEIGKLLRDVVGTQSKIHLYGQPKINVWQGRESVEFMIEDVMLA